MNLLSEQDQKNIAKERIFRLLIVNGFFILSLLIIALILLIPPYLFLVLQSAELIRVLDIEKQSAELHQAETIESSIRILNQRVKILHANENELRDPSTVIKAVIDKKPRGITLGSFLYDKGANEKADVLSVVGHAATRDILLRFIAVLEKEPLFMTVHSPVSNLLSKDKVEFSLTLDLAAL